MTLQKLKKESYRWLISAVVVVAQTGHNGWISLFAYPLSVSESILIVYYSIKNMRASVLTDVEEMTVMERRRPEPGSQEVLIRVGATGVCMTDYHTYHGSLQVEKPVILGHEIAGTVAAVGNNVTDHDLGDRVAVNPIVSCGTCSACIRGNTHLCEKNTSIGGAGENVIDGAFSEFVCVPAATVEDIGDLSFTQAALAEPLGCCVHGMDRSGLEQGDSAAIIGAGPIGLMILQTLRNRGIAPIAVAEPDDYRRKLAADLGADVIVDPNKRDTVQIVEKEIGDVDAGIEVVGKVQTIKQAYTMTAKGGTALIFGVPGQEAMMNINPFDIYFREIDIHGTYALSQESFERALTLLRNDRINTDLIITEEIGLADIPEAFDKMANNNGLKKVIAPNK